MSLCQDNQSFETWLAAQCALVESDIAYKHHRMKKSPFIFLRATYFRWAKTVALACPAWPDAPKVLSVGDIHIENYGVWRDAEGRLIWGVNDFDEAAIMPFTCDLVRLTASATLSDEFDLSIDETAGEILSGYQRGLADPKPIVLDRDHIWMRRATMCSPKKRRKFWENLDACATASAPPEVETALQSSLPKGAKIERFIERLKIGGGSLGKPRFAVIAQWRGGHVVREAKAATVSAWHWAHSLGKAPETEALKLAFGAHRAPDPHLKLENDYFIRRLAPDNRKIEQQDLKTSDKRAPQILNLMGQELGSLHAGAKTKAIEKHLAQHDGEWLQEAAECAINAVRADFHEWSACT